MKCSFPVLVAVIIWSTGAFAQDVLVRTSLEPKNQAMLGQKIRLLVDVLFVNGMDHPPRVSEPQVVGAQVFRFESQATNMTKRIGNTDYVGQRFEFDLYAWRAGSIAVPPVQVTLLDRNGDPIGSEQGSGVTLQAVVPPGLDPSDTIVASRSVTIREEWQPASITRLNPGDAVVRRITRTAAGVPGLALAVLPVDAPTGVRAYADPSDIEDRSERGEVTGMRIDRITYVFEQPGRFVIAAVKQPWWDLRIGRSHMLDAAGRVMEVEAPAEVATGRNKAFISIVITSSLLFLTAGYLVHRLVLHHRGQRNPQVQAEALAFQILRRACRADDPVTTYRAWQSWHPAHASLLDFPEMLREVAVLEAYLFGDGAGWDRADADRLLWAVSAARARRRIEPRLDTLPPLNPDTTPALDRSYQPTAKI